MGLMLHRQSALQPPFGAAILTKQPAGWIIRSAKHPSAFPLSEMRESVTLNTREIHHMAKGMDRKKETKKPKKPKK